MGKKVKESGRIGSVFYHDVEVLGGLRVECFDPDPRDANALPRLVGVYMNTSAHNLITALKPAFISVLCDRLSLSYTHDSGEDGQRKWSRLVGDVMAAPCSGFKRPRRKRS